MHKIRQFILGIIVLSSLNSCLSSKKAVKKIPADASFVMKVNMVSIALKLFREDPDVKKDAAYFLDMSDKDGETEMTRRLQKSGINFIRAYVFGNPALEKDSYFALAFSINNHRRFHEFYERYAETHLIKEIDDGIKYVKLYPGILMGWTEDVLVILRMGNKESEDTLVTKLKSIFNTSEEESLLANNENFESIHHLFSDVLFWGDLGKLSQIPKFQNFVQSHNRLGLLNFSDNYLQSFLHFKHGEIHAETKYFVSDSTANRYQNLLRSHIHRKIVDNVPAHEMEGLVSVGTHMNEIWPLIEDLDLLDLAHKSSRLIDLSVDEMFSMFNGDAVLVLKEIKEKPLEDVYEDVGDMFNTGNSGRRLRYVVAFGLGLAHDRTLYEDLINSLLETSLLKQKGDGYYVFFNEIFLLERDGILYVSKAPEFEENFENKAGLHDKEIDHLASHNGLLLYLNRNSLETIILREGIPNNKIMNLLLNLPVESFLFNMHTLHENHIRGDFTIKLTESEKNSIVIFYQALKESFFENLSLQNLNQD